MRTMQCKVNKWEYEHIRNSTNKGEEILHGDNPAVILTPPLFLSARDPFILQKRRIRDVQYNTMQYLQNLRPRLSRLIYSNIVLHMSSGTGAPSITTDSTCATKISDQLSMRSNGEYCESWCGIMARKVS